MEPEGSLPHSQASATRPYPGLAQSSPHAHNPPPGDPSLYYPPIYTQTNSFYRKCKDILFSTSSPQEI